MPTAPSALRVLWISDFPIEWLPGAPEEIRALPRQHPLTWLRVLEAQMTEDPGIELHIAVLRKNVARDVTFTLPGGTTIHVLKIMGGIRAPTLFCADSIRLRPLVKKLKPHVIHAWGTERGAVLVASRLGTPYLASVQGLMSWYAETVPVNRHEKFAAVLEKWSLPKAPLVSGESLSTVDYLRRHYPRQKVLHIEHSPAPHFYEIQRKPRLTPPRLLFVGSLNFRKGGDVLLAALEQLGPRVPFEFVVVGYVELQAEWDRLSTGPLAGRLLEKRGLPPDEVAAELAEATMLAFPTRADTGPVAVKEAAVAGVPVVGTRVGGIPDYITDGDNGILVDTGDVGSLAAGIERALAHPRFSRGEVCPDALARVREWLSPALMKRNFCAAYRELAGNEG